MNPEKIVIEDLVVREQPKAALPAAAPVPPAPAVDLENRLGSYMTHELRAPLTSVRSALGILEEQLAGRLSDEERQVLSLAVKNADRLGGLINDIMDFSKLRAGRMAFNAAAVHPDELIREAIDSLRAWAVRKGVRLVHMESEEPLPRILADSRRALQALLNLLSNAIKFTPAGGKVEISARLGRHEHLGTVCFRVKDTGPGIPAADLERVFCCFEQSATGAKTSEGTGLGLTLSRMMIEAQGGRIWAESWRGLGATFLFTLPLAPSDNARKVRAYPRRVEYHGLLVRLFRRLNAVVVALFA